MLITVLSKSLEDKGKYKVLDIAYKDEDGATKGKKLMSFGEGAPSHKAMLDANPGETWEVMLKKGEKYWDWVSAVKTDKKTAGNTTTNPVNPSFKRDFETAEERARKQVIISRQAMINAAIEYLNHNKKNYEVQEILNTASILLDFVNEVPKLEDITDDIPFQ